MPNGTESGHHGGVWGDDELTIAERYCLPLNARILTSAVRVCQEMKSWLALSPLEDEPGVLRPLFEQVLPGDRQAVADVASASLAGWVPIVREALGGDMDDGALCDAAVRHALATLPLLQAVTASVGRGSRRNSAIPSLVRQGVLDALSDEKVVAAVAAIVAYEMTVGAEAAAPSAVTSAETRSRWASELWEWCDNPEESPDAVVDPDGRSGSVDRRPAPLRPPPWWADPVLQVIAACVAVRTWAGLTGVQLPGGPPRRSDGWNAQIKADAATDASPALTNRWVQVAARGGAIRYPRTEVGSAVKRNVSVTRATAADKARREQPLSGVGPDGEGRTTDIEDPWAPNRPELHVRVESKNRAPNATYQRQAKRVEANLAWLLDVGAVDPRTANAEVDTDEMLRQAEALTDPLLFAAGDLHPVFRRWASVARSRIKLVLTITVDPEETS